MALSTLQITHVRNLRQVKLQKLGRVNVFFGNNGSGKTSLLEAIHILGMARSFRGSGIRTLITHGENDLTVFGTANAAGATLSLGVQRTITGDSQIKVAGRVISTVAELAGYLPLQTITADSFDLLTGAPAARRQFLDWGVFHVEQRFLSQWRRFQRCLKQRNMLLRRGNINAQEMRVWTRDLAISGSAVGGFRRAYFDQLLPRFRTILSELAPTLGVVDLVYRQGWDRQLSYDEALENGAKADQEQGYTHSGPQRADIRVMHDGYLASDTLSRGQQKLVVCSLKLAQGQLMSELRLGRCTYLIDDLSSELDQKHSRLICSRLATMDAQVFITCVDPQDITAVWPATVWPEEAELAMFHVEHGNVARHLSG